MRLRKLALAVGLAGAMSAEMASALGLGEIKLNSSLNEPLDAEIKLLQTRDLDEGEILVALAGKEDFQNAGVDRTFFLNDLKFKVHLNGASGSVIRVTSNKPVREPYLNFLLQTQWPNGRILREYTLLMDLPVFSQETAKPVIRSQATTPQPVAQPQKKQPEPRQTIAKPQAPAKQSHASTKPQSSSAASTYGPVQSSDTLWEIALKVRPDRSVSVHKTMLAIQRLNPEAFINGNINLLRKGQVLRVPDSQEINELSRQEAVSQVAVQNRAWNDSRSSASGPQLDASTRFDADRPKASKVEGRLTLAAAEKVDTARAGQMGGSGTDTDTESLQNELAISLEELDKSKRENAELNDRIRELEDQIGTMERLIEVSNQELRALQLANKVRSGEMTESEAQTVAAEEAAAVEAARQAALAEQADESVDESELFSEADDEMTAADESQDVAAEAAQAQSAPAGPAESDKVKDKASKVVSAPPPKPGLMDTLMENIALIGGGAAAILLAVLLLLRRRKPEEETTLESYDSDMEQASELGDDETVQDDVELIADEEVVDPADIDDEVLDEEDFNSESETGDAVAEADIYIAYGKFDQAEEMLVKAIDSGDNPREARLKLLEVYAESDNLPGFDQQYAAVLSMNDDEAAARGAELREQFANAPAFDMDSVESVVETAQEFDLDLDDVSVAEPSELDTDDGLPDLDFELEGVGEATESPSEDEGFDFDLDLDSDLESESVDEGLTLDLDGDAEVADEGLDLDLDLELDETSTDEGFELDLDDAETSDEEPNDEFSLDVEGLEELEGGESIDLEIDGESDISFESGDADEVPGLESLAEDLGDLGEVESTDEVAADLSLEDDDEGFQTFDMDETTLEPDVPEDADEDDFDLSGDFDGDLASLDEEMEELSADLDSVEESDDAFGETALELETEESATEEVDVADLSLDAELSTEEVEQLDGAEEELDLSFDAGEAEEEVESNDISFDAEEFSISAEDLDMDSEAVDLGEDFALEEGQDLEDVSLDAQGEQTGGFEIPDSLEADLAAIGSAEPEMELSSELEVEPDLDAGGEEPSEDMDLSVEDEVFSQALSDVPSSDDAELAQELPEAEAAIDEDDLEAELDFLSDTDEVATKLDLARAYIDMGDHDGAKDILDEVVQEGSDEQKKEAEELLSKV